MEQLAHEPDVGAGAWIAPRLALFGGTVGSVVPRAFDAYARVLHPVEGGGGRAVESSGGRAVESSGERPVESSGGRAVESSGERPAEADRPAEAERLLRWSDVAAVTGRTVHPLAQFWRVAGRRSPYDSSGSLWRGGEPRIGNLDQGTLAVLLEVLGANCFGGLEAECVAALWEGWGWIDGGGVAVLTNESPEGSGPLPTGASPAGSQPMPPGFSSEVLAARRLMLPARGYLLFRGPLCAVPSLGHQVSAEWFEPQSPSLLWPEDRSWCVATEIDFDSTLVGGYSELIDDVLADPRLEAYPVHPDDALQFDADTVN